MRLFVTGGTGFIGSHFLNLAAHRGHTVIALRRKGSQPRVPVLKEPHWIEGDLDADFATEFKGIDCLVHLASHSANTPYDNLHNCLYWNVLASTRLLTSAISSGVSRFLIAGTCFEYGLSANDFEFIPPSAPLRPIWTYPISKAAASEVFMGLARDHQVSLSILRLFQIFGEGEQESRFYPSLCRAALAGHDFEMSSGEQIRDFTPVELAAQRLLEAAEILTTSQPQIRIQNVGTGTPKTLLQFAEEVWAMLGAQGQLRPGTRALRPNELKRIAPQILSEYYPR